MFSFYSAKESSALCEPKKESDAFFLYLKKSSALQMVCRIKLDSIKYKNYDNAASFFDNFEKSVNEVKAAGGTINEDEKLRYLLKALPPEFNFIGDLIDVLQEDQRTCEYVKSKVLIKTMESENNKSDKQSSNAFVADMRGKCFKCGGTGHKLKDCKKGQSHQVRGRGNQRNGGVFQRGVGRGYERDGYRGFRRGSYSRGYHTTTTEGVQQHQINRKSVAEMNRRL
ncbi:Copia protein [Cyphomyrmex costatus]|uniref:Copia protein n=1 Tax=Cyphomyrmex costatus TaxID=456900 RepID=A0A151I8J0_9HYME|nr:Copia protein [Cyphomyrmex costatus]